MTNPTFNLDDPTSDDVETACELIEEIESVAEDMPEEAEDFGQSVLETVADITKYIEDNDRVTKKQITALENMLDGLRQWIRD